jgi:RHS repeat-associated protein
VDPDYTVDANLNRTDYEYDRDEVNGRIASGLLLSKTNPADASGKRLKTVFAYDQKYASYIDINGATSYFTDPIWKLSSAKYCTKDENCNGTADQVITEYGYDKNLLVNSITTKTGTGEVLSVVRSSYDPIGNLVGLHGPDPSDSDGVTFFYNSVRQKTGEIGRDPDGAGPLMREAVRYTYDGAGKLISVRSGKALGQSQSSLDGMTVEREVVTDYDAHGRKSKERYLASGNIYAINQFSYDEQGRIKCSAVRMDRSQWSGQVDACVPQLSGPDGPDRITRYSYDAVGQLLKITKAYGVTQANGYPGNLQQDHASYVYSANGQKTGISDAKGNYSSLAYDGFDRLEKLKFPSKVSAGNSSDTDYEQYGYDPNGNRTTFRKRDGSTIGYSYDALNRIIVKQPSSGRAVRYEYDLRGLVTSALFDNPTEGILNKYDGLGRLSSTESTMGGGSLRLSYDYNADGNVSKIIYPDEVRNSAGVATVPRHFNYAYDHAGRLTQIFENENLQIASFSYNSAGQRQSIGTGFQTNFAYDLAGRLGSVEHVMPGGRGVTYCMGTMNGASCNETFNAAGQALQRAVSNSSYIFSDNFNLDRGYEINGLNQYTKIAGVSRSYDDNGNMTSDGDATYTYDIENRLVMASDAFGLTMLSYDPLGRLWQTAKGNAITRFVYDGDRLISEYDGGGAMLHRYVHGSGVDEPLVWYKGAGLGDRRNMRGDNQGSIVAISDAAGNSLDLNTFDEYGVFGRRNASRFGYTGQMFIPEIGLYYYKARMYAPTLGRFLQVDPVGYYDQMNIYAYVGNDPINASDPSGMIRICPGGRECYDDGTVAPEGMDMPDAVVTAPSQGGAFSGGPGGMGEPSGPIVNIPQIDEIVVTGSCRGACPGQKYIVGDGRYTFNPDYVDPAPWLNLYTAIAIPPLVGSGAVILPELGPAGAIFGRARVRAGQGPGVLNSRVDGEISYGWSWLEGWAGTRNYLGVHGGRPGTSGHWHVNPIPGPK